jgi:hypothetical protein
MKLTCTEKTMPLKQCLPAINTKRLPWVSAPQRSHVAVQNTNVDICNLVLTRRIGSPSANGVVFECECGLGTHSAIKFIQPGSAADNELDVAIHLSQRVQQGLSTRFPVVYATAHCPQIQMDENDHFTRSVKEAYVCQQLVVAQKDAKVLRPGQMKRLKKGQSVLALEELSQELPADVVQQIVQCPTFAADALISEIAYSDVNYLIQQGITDAEVSNIVQQVLEGCASQPW